MKVKYWKNFAKRKNSTKQPLAADATEVDIRLKDDNTIVNPAIEASSIPTEANYFYIDDFKRYYFLDNETKTTAMPLSVFSLESDVLASFKSEIGSTVAHIAYASTGFNKEIVDSRIAVTGEKTLYRSDLASLGFNSGGCYVIGVINDTNDGKLGAISYYALDPTTMYHIFDKMLNSTFMNDLNQYFNGKTIDLITYCMWLPVTTSTLVTMGCAGSLSNIHIGKEDLGLTWGYPIVKAIGVVPSGTYDIASLTIPYKWQDFRDCQPYSSLSIYLPGIGLTDLNVNDFYGSTTVNVKTWLDATTGDIVYWIMDAGTNVLKTITFNGGANVALAQITTNAAGAVTAIGGVAGGAVGMGAAAAMGNIPGVITGGVGMMAAGTGAVIQANQRTTSIKGTNNGRSGFATNQAFLVMVECETEDCDDANYIARCGRPVAKTQAISNHSGYVQCEGASVSMAGTALEKDRVNQYLNTGFFYE